MKPITIGNGIDPIAYTGISYLEKISIPVGVGVGVGINGASVGWSKDIAEVSIDWA